MGNLRDLIVNINYLKEKKRGTDSLYTFQPEWIWRNNKT